MVPMAADKYGVVHIAKSDKGEARLEGHLPEGPKGRGFGGPHGRPFASGDATVHPKGSTGFVVLRRLSLRVRKQEGKNSSMDFGSIEAISLLIIGRDVGLG